MAKVASKISFINRVISLVLCVSILFTQCLFAHKPVTSVWDERANSRPVLAQLPNVPSDIFNASISNLNKFSLGPGPSKLNSGIQKLTANSKLKIENLLPYGSIRNVSPSQKAESNAPVVFYIQDVHSNYEAQKNISGAISALMESVNVNLLALEGAFSPLNLAGFSKTTEPALFKKSADYFLGTKELSGPLHAYLTAVSKKRTPLPSVVGIDDESHYEANVRAYLQASPQADEYLSRVEKEEGELSRQKKVVFSPPLLDFDTRVQRYRHEKCSMAEHVQYLDTQGVVSSKELKNFLEAARLESEINIPRLERQRKQLLENLAVRLSGGEINELTSLSQRLQMREVTYVDFYSYLKTLCAKKGLSLLHYPDMESYIRYVLLTDGINASRLLTDVGKAEESGYAKLISSSVEKQLVARSNEMALLKKLFRFALTSEEWKTLNEQEAGELPTISEKTLFLFKNFYEEAAIRDEKMAANLLKAFAVDDAAQGDTSKYAVLVTGGFHSSGIEQRLTKAGCTVITFVPRFKTSNGENLSRNSDDKANSEPNNYLSVFAQEKAPIDSLFEGEKLFLAPKQTPPLARVVLVAASLAVNPNRFLKMILPFTNLVYVGRKVDEETTRVAWKNKLSGNIRQLEIKGHGALLQRVSSSVPSVIDNFFLVGFRELFDTFRFNFVALHSIESIARRLQISVEHAKQQIRHNQIAIHLLSGISGSWLMVYSLRTQTPIFSFSVALFVSFFVFNPLIHGLMVNVFRKMTSGALASIDYEWDNPEHEASILRAFRALLAEWGVPIYRQRVNDGEVLNDTYPALMTTRAIKNLVDFEGFSPKRYLEILNSSLKLGSNMRVPFNEFSNKFGLVQGGTHWFRYQNQIELIVEGVRDMEATNPLKIIFYGVWNGEEAYSLAIALEVSFPDRIFEIEGVDLVSPDVSRLNWLPLKSLPSSVIPFVETYFDQQTERVVSLKPAVIKRMAHVKFRQGDMREDEAMDGSADIVIANAILDRRHGVRTRVSDCAKTVLRVLKPGGYFYFDSSPDDEAPSFLTDLLTAVSPHGEFLRGPNNFELIKNTPTVRPASVVFDLLLFPRIYSALQARYKLNTSKIITGLSLAGAGLEGLLAIAFIDHFGFSAGATWLVFLLVVHIALEVQHPNFSIRAPPLSSSNLARLIVFSLYLLFPTFGVSSLFAIPLHLLFDYDSIRHHLRISPMMFNKGQLNARDLSRVEPADTAMERTLLDPQLQHGDKVKMQSLPWNVRWFLNFGNRKTEGALVLIGGAVRDLLNRESGFSDFDTTAVSPLAEKEGPVFRNRVEGIQPRMLVFERPAGWGIAIKRFYELLIAMKPFSMNLFPAGWKARINLFVFGRFFDGHYIDMGFSLAVTPDGEIHRANPELSINTMGITSNGVFLDPWNGRQDLVHRVARIVGPLDNFTPDTILRIFRLKHKLNLSWDPDTFEVLRGVAASFSSQFEDPQSRVQIALNNGIKNPSHWAKHARKMFASAEDPQGVLEELTEFGFAASFKHIGVDLDVYLKDAMARRNKIDRPLYFPYYSEILRLVVIGAAIIIFNVQSGVSVGVVYAFIHALAHFRVDSKEVGWRQFLARRLWARFLLSSVFSGPYLLVLLPANPASLLFVSFLIGNSLHHLNNHWLYEKLGGRWLKMTIKKSLEGDDVGDLIVAAFIGMKKSVVPIKNRENIKRWLIDILHFEESLRSSFLEFSIWDAYKIMPASDPAKYGFDEDSLSAYLSYRCIPNETAGLSFVKFLVQQLNKDEVVITDEFLENAFSAPEQFHVLMSLVNPYRRKAQRERDEFVTFAEGHDWGYYLLAAMRDAGLPPPVLVLLDPHTDLNGEGVPMGGVNSARWVSNALTEGLVRAYYWVDINNGQVKFSKLKEGSVDESGRVDIRGIDFIRDLKRFKDEGVPYLLSPDADMLSLFDLTTAQVDQIRSLSEKSDGDDKYFEILKIFHSRKRIRHESSNDFKKILDPFFLWLQRNVGPPVRVAAVTSPDYLDPDLADAHWQSEFRAYIREASERIFTDSSGPKPIHRLGVHTLYFLYYSEMVRLVAIGGAVIFFNVQSGVYAGVVFAFIHALAHIFKDALAPSPDITWKRFFLGRFWWRVGLSLLFSIPYLLVFSPLSIFITAPLAFLLANALHHFNNTTWRAYVKERWGIEWLEMSAKATKQKAIENAKSDPRRPRNINVADWVNLTNKYTKWETLRNSTLVYLVQELMRIKKISNVFELQDADFKNVAIPLINKGLGRLLHNFKKDGKSARRSLLEGIGLLEPLNKIKTFEELKKRIDSGEFYRNGAGNEIPWLEFNLPFQRMVVGEVACIKLNISDSEWGALTQDDKDKKILSLTTPDFSRESQKLKVTFESFYTGFLKEYTKKKLAKNGRWYMFEKLGYVPSNLPSYSELQTSLDIERLLKSGAINRLEWDSIFKNNLVIGRRLVKEMCAVLFLKVETENALDNAVNKMTDAEALDYISQLKAANFKPRDFGDAYRNFQRLEDILPRFFEYINDHIELGKGFHLFLKERFNFLRKERGSHEAFVLSAIRRLTNLKGHSSSLWKSDVGIPVEGLRALLNRLRILLSGKNNDKEPIVYLKLTDIPTRGYYALGLPTPNGSLGGLFSEKRQKKRGKMTVNEYVVRDAGFVLSIDSFKSSLESAAKIFTQPRSSNLNKEHQSLVGFLNASFENLDVPTAKRVRAELDGALLGIIDELNAKPGNVALQDLLASFRCLWALLDTAEWMPEEFLQLVKKTSKLDFKKEENFILGSLTTLSNQAVNARRAFDYQFVSGLIIEFQKNIFVDIEPASAALLYLDNLAKSFPLAIDKSIRFLLRNNPDISLYEFLISKDGASFVQLLETELKLEGETLEGNLVDFAVQKGVAPAPLSNEELREIRAEFVAWGKGELGDKNNLPRSLSLRPVRLLIALYSNPPNEKTAIQMGVGFYLRKQDIKEILSTFFASKRMPAFAKINSASTSDLVLTANSTRVEAGQRGYAPYGFWTEVFFAPDHESLKVFYWVFHFKEFFREHPGSWRQHVGRTVGLLAIHAAILAPPFLLGFEGAFSFWWVGSYVFSANLSNRDVSDSERFLLRFLTAPVYVPQFATHALLNALLFLIITLFTPEKSSSNLSPMRSVGSKLMTTDPSMEKVVTALEQTPAILGVGMATVRFADVSSDRKIQKQYASLSARSGLNCLVFSSVEDKNRATRLLGLTDAAESLVSFLVDNDDAVRSLSGNDRFSKDVHELTVSVEWSDIERFPNSPLAKYFQMLDEGRVEGQVAMKVETVVTKDMWLFTFMKVVPLGILIQGLQTKIGAFLLALKHA